MGESTIKTKKYRLYLFAVNKDNIELAVHERFHRINKQYILVYTDNLFSHVQKARYHIIDESETGRLSDSERVWLLEANMKIIMEESEKKQDEILKSFAEKIDRLEQELAKEAEKIEKETDGING